MSFVSSLQGAETVVAENGDASSPKKQENEASPKKQTEDAQPAEGEDAEKKKKKRNRKKGGAKTGQTDPPSVPIVDLFPDQVFPEGEIMQYPVPKHAPKDDRTAKDRFTSEEKRALDRMHNDIYNEVRLAAEAHRQVGNKRKVWLREVMFTNHIMFI